MVDDLRIYDPLDNEVFVKKIKSEIPAYITLAVSEDGGVPTEITADPLNFHYLESGKVGPQQNVLKKIHGRSYLYEAAKKIVLLQPTSATAERLNSVLDARFGKRKKRALSDLITASLMLWQNKRTL